MKFHEWISLCQLLRNVNRQCRNLRQDELHAMFYSPDYRKRQWGGQGEEERCRARVYFEMDWVADERPYYNVWPVVLDPMQKVRLDLPADCFSLPKRPICLRFPVGCEPRSEHGVRLHSILFQGTRTPEGHYGLLVTTQSDYDASGDQIDYISFPLLSEKTVEDGIAEIESVWAKTISSQTQATNRLAVRFAVGLCLLKDDPDLVIPDVLADDRIKFDETGDQKYVEKARRRGKVGWNVGSHLEVDPHFRRAHFGLRWTGEGRRVPRIVPIKGCIVKRHKLTQVPTGALGPADD